MHCVAKLARKLTQRELLVSSLEPSVLATGILPSVWPKVSREFGHIDLNEKCRKILLEARRKIITQCSLVEVNRDIRSLRSSLTEAGNTADQLKKELHLSN